MSLYPHDLKTTYKIIIQTKNKHKWLVLHAVWLHFAKDSQDLNQNIFDEDEIIREYKPHHQRPVTSAPPVSYKRPYDASTQRGSGSSGLHELDMRDYYYYHPDIYNKANHDNPCSARQFRCGNNVCIPLHLRCDNFYHCNDMTDEFNCDQYKAEATSKTPSTTTETAPANIIKTTMATLANSTQGIRSSTTTTTLTTPIPPTTTTVAAIIRPSFRFTTTTMAPSMFYYTKKMASNFDFFRRIYFFFCWKKNISLSLTLSVTFSSLEEFLFRIDFSTKTQNSTNH